MKELDNDMLYNVTGGKGFRDYRDSRDYRYTIPSYNASCTRCGTKFNADINTVTRCPRCG